MDADFNDIMARLRKKHPKKGPNPEKGEDMNHWAERYTAYIREKYKDKLSH